jgi:hypothetical protein
MKKWLENNIGKSWKTTLTGYLMAALIAVQPFLTEVVDLSDKHQRNRYILRIIVAAGVAILGKQAADSHQVKQVDEKVDEHLNE